MANRSTWGLSWGRSWSWHWEREPEEAEPACPDGVICTDTITAGNMLSAAITANNFGTTALGSSVIDTEEI